MLLDLTVIYLVGAPILISLVFGLLLLKDASSDRLPVESAGGPPRRRRPAH